MQKVKVLVKIEVVDWIYARNSAVKEGLDNKYAKLKKDTWNRT